MNGNFWSRGLRVAITVLAALLLVWGVAALNGAGFSNPVADSKEALNPSTSKDCKTWQTKPSDYSNNRWFADGIAEIREAKTDKQAREAANVWLDKVKTDPVLLEGAAKYLTHKKVSKADLSADGCATTEAVDLVTEIALVLGQSRITPGTAPSNGHNSGVSKGQVVGSATSGVYGNRTAIKVVLPDGKIVWIMARCGNPVTKGAPPVPHGPTDNPPPPHKCVEIPNNGAMECESKDPSQDPNAQGNAPQGGGKNEDSGPGTYIPPGDMDKPSATPRTNPPPPSGGGSGGGSTPTPDPAPAPSPEPSAPKPSNPETGCIVIPGVEDCK